MDKRELIQATKTILFNKGYFREADFSGVDIRWFPLLKSTSGMVPDRSKLLINVSHTEDSARQLAPIMAHEMVHIKQYIGKGSNDFKCQYSEQFLKCGYQNRGHPLEKEAYEFEDIVRSNI